ncbi:wiskott-Aldrich syndrome [Brachionus plicatilis]|uniref:Wiskott-Aldrich syndrome n=1 Tax=Brachionus plicatilis TaxID=10195 RepID=A0A3M7RI19_BRAPC|nr:wiskott-Aldrich syndrome [Brachionus plicatilis]
MLCLGLVCMSVYSCRPVELRDQIIKRLEQQMDTLLTDFLEKDNFKVLATAAAQLFISAPHLDKWFKSSTGTICFLKNFSHKNSFFFRLYSLMQGKLWEQEMSAPFHYKKAGPLFHFLTVNRFNYGFKFICEDEAERFLSCVKKSVENFGESRIEIDAPRPLKVTRRNLSADLCGSYLAASQSFKKPDDQSTKRHKSRRESLTRIDKSVISCPFRCSSTDLNAKVDATDSSQDTPQYPIMVKRALSSASQTSTSTKQINVSTGQCQTKILSGSTSTINTLSINALELHSSPETIQSTPKMPTKHKDITEMDIIKDLLVKFNVSINKKMIKVLKDYMGQFGGLDKFRKAMENRDEYIKLNAYIAATNASLIRETVVKQQNRYQTVYPMNAMATPPSPIMAPKGCYPTPTTPVAALKKYEPLTPFSVNSKTLSLSDRTPVRNTLIASCVQSGRTDTPSPLRQVFKSAAHLNHDSNAPPKPPRRSSLKVN